MARTLVLLLVTALAPAIPLEGGAALDYAQDKAAAAPTPPGFDMYILGLMHRGSGDLPAGETAESLQKAHIANLNTMWDEGLLLASGPIADKGELRGVVIFRGDDRAAVERRVNADPLIRSGRLRIALKPWMGPEKIGTAYKEWTTANPGAADKMRTYQLVLMRPAPTAAPLTPAEQLAHLKNMAAMVEAGHLMVAGPVLEPGDLAGLFVFDTDAAEAAKLVAGDPAVSSKKMVVEQHPWLVAELVLPKGFKVPLP